MASPKEFDCIDVFKTKVSCSKKRWEHVCKHAEMVCHQNLVKSIIIKPDFVCKSRSSLDRYTFYRKCWLAKLGRYERYIRVVIQYSMNEKREFRGGVINSFACDGMKLGEVIIWRGRAI